MKLTTLQHSVLNGDSVSEHNLNERFGALPLNGYVCLRVSVLARLNHVQHP